MELVAVESRQVCAAVLCRAQGLALSGKGIADMSGEMMPLFGFTGTVSDTTACFLAASLGLHWLFMLVPIRAILFHCLAVKLHSICLSFQRVQLK